MSSRSAELERIVDAIRRRQRFVISSHSRPDGDSIGSQLARAFALRALGKLARARNRPQSYRERDAERYRRRLPQCAIADGKSS